MLYLTLMPETQAEQSYRVRYSSGLKPNETITGTFACSTGKTAINFLDALDSLSQTEVNDGILAVIPEEFQYSHHQDLVPDLVRSGVDLSGIVTFGTTYRGSHLEGSHLTIICRELNIPLCIARAPRRAFHEKKSRIDLYSKRLEKLHNTAGRITLSSDGRKVKLATNQ